MDRQWGPDSLRFDKKVDRITYGGGTVQAMDKHWIFWGSLNARGVGARGVRGAGELTIDVASGSKDRLGISAWLKRYYVKL